MTRKWNYELYKRLREKYNCMRPFVPWEIFTNGLYTGHLACKHSHFNVETTSFLRHDILSTLKQSLKDVMCLLDSREPKPYRNHRRFLIDIEAFQGFMGVRPCGDSVSNPDGYSKIVSRILYSTITSGRLELENVGEC